jgi:hypothetical protein
MSAAVAAASPAAAAAAGWSPQQRCYRGIMRSLRGAYYGDRAKLFWARHRVKVEFYKYSGVAAGGPQPAHLVAVGDDVGRFVAEHMAFSMQRVEAHNATLARLPVVEAKRFRAQYLEKEKEHDSWCKQKIRTMLLQRAPPPYPFC